MGALLNQKFDMVATKPAPKPLRKILVVDDNIDQVHSLTYLLRDMGHAVDYAINGIIALHMAQRFKPDVVLLDLGLPDAHGAEIARQLRRDPELRRVRIVAITGRTGKEEHIRAAAAGCDAILLKPLSAASLEDAVAL
jgi:CheY-like chemotaxis protein